MTATHALYDVDPFAITICKKGANRKRIFLKKTADEPSVLPHRDGILKDTDANGDWSVFYCVVAEPDAEEDGGQGAAGIVDVWKDEHEIRRAAHRFAKNKGYVNAMHGALAEQDCHVVENAVALHDFEVGGETIRKGSWYIAIEPGQAFRELVDAGEITGVSMEGSGLREAVAKFENADACPKCGGKVAYERGKCPNCGAKSPVHKVSSRTLPSLDRKKGGASNWVEAAGGLPDFIERIAKHLHYEQGMTISHAIAAAVSQVKKWAAGGAGVNPATQAKAAKALAEWEAKRARGRLKKETDVSQTGQTETLEEKESLWRKAGQVLGFIAKDDEEELTPEERASLDALRARPSSLGDKKPEGDDIHKSTTKDENMETERIERIEKAVADQGEAMSKLIGLVEKLATRERGDDEKPTADTLKKSLEDFGSAMTEQIAKLSEGIDALATGQSSQQEEDRAPVKKSDNPLAGILA